MISCWYLESLLKADFQDDSKNNNLRLQQSNHHNDCHLHKKIREIRIIRGQKSTQSHEIYWLMVQG